jgi:hypothetical protein
LYESLGFRTTGEVHYDETVMCLGCDASQRQGVPEDGSPWSCRPEPQ